MTGRYDVTRYRSWVTYDVDGEERELSMEFDGGPTDYYWNHGVARDFYAERVAAEGGVVRAYGTGPPGKPGTLTATFDVTGLTYDEVGALEGEVAAQGEASDDHPDAPFVGSVARYDQAAV